MNRSLKPHAIKNETRWVSSKKTKSTTSSPSHANPFSRRGEMSFKKSHHSNFSKFVRSSSCNIKTQIPVKRKLSYQTSSIDLEMNLEDGIEDLCSVSVMHGNEGLDSFDGVKELSMEDSASFLSSRSCPSDCSEDEGCYGGSLSNRLEETNHDGEVFEISISRIHELITSEVTGLGFEINFDLERALSEIFNGFKGKLSKEKVQTIFGLGKAEVAVGEYACYRVFEQYFDFTF